MNQPAPPPDRRAPGWRAKLILLAVSLVIALLLGEVMVRIFAPQPTYAFPQYLFENYASRTYRLCTNFEGIVHTPEYKVPVKINSRGLRNPEVTSAHPGRLRVLVLGDSFVMGYYSLEKKSFVRYIERALREKLGDNVEMINTGVPSYGNVQEVTFLREEGAWYRPDVVLMAFCLSNDERDNTFPERYEIVDGWRVRRGHRPNLHSLAFRYSDLYRLYHFMREKDEIDLENRVRLFEKVTNATMQEQWDATSRALDDYVRTSQSLHAPPYIVMIPEAVQVYPKFWKIVEKQNPERDLVPDKPDRVLEQMCQEKKIPTLDLLPVLKQHNDQQLYFRHDPHWTPAGCKIAGTATGQWLADEILAASPDLMQSLKEK